MSMEDHLAQILANTQLPEQEPRIRAELDLKLARANPAFPSSLANIASHTSISIPIRQAALSALRQFIEQNWADDDGDPSGSPVIEIDEPTRERLRVVLLDLALNKEADRKIRMSASYAVGKIAINDYPDQWPTLLQTVLAVIPAGTDAQLHGALGVLLDLIVESVAPDQFFSMAGDIVKVVTEVALNEGRKPALRSLAISVFRGCFDLMDTIKVFHPKEIKAFADELVTQWSPFFLSILRSRLPAAASAEVGSGQPPEWNSLISLKLQVVKTLLKIKSVFAELLLPQSGIMFQLVWEELASAQATYGSLYIDNEAQGRLEDADGLPYTLDLLILEELDFLNKFFRARPVYAELGAQLAAHASAHETPWMMDMIKMLVSYSRITREEEGLWDIDCSLYLAEEASVSTNYTARTAAGDLLIKLGESFTDMTVDGLFCHTKDVFTRSESEWRSRESALYLYNMLLSDIQETERTVSGPIAQAYLGLVEYAISRADQDQQLLRARGFLLGGKLAGSIETPPDLLSRTVEAISSQEFGGGVTDVVQVACLKAIGGYTSSTQSSRDSQVSIIMAISRFMAVKDGEDTESADEVVVALAEALRAAIGMDAGIALSAEVPALDLLFMVTKLGASNFQVAMLVCEAFEDIVRVLSNGPSYAAVCSRVLPTLMSAFDVAPPTEDHPLVTVVVELLVVLTQYGTEPLPAGFVAAVLPKLSRMLMEATEGDILRPGTETVQNILRHDHHQVFSWQDDNGRSGLEVCLRIIDRLLGPSIEENSASQVGGLAAELVEKAGQERLGPFLSQLLRAVADRLATAQAASFIQSLIVVFARLSLVGAQDVVEFLSSIVMEGQSGLQVVLDKWLENSTDFAGYDEIRQNVIALSKIYSLNDPRLSQIMVKGDLIIDDNNHRVKTRSQARLNPDRYTMVPAALKVLKVLIGELASASGFNSGPLTAEEAASAAAEAADKENDDGWEDIEDTLDLSLDSTKAEIMSFIEQGRFNRHDDQTQTYLTDFFLRAARDNVAGFQDWYSMLTREEQAKLNELVPSQG